MVLHDREIMSVEEIIAKFSIPEPLAIYYNRQAPFFKIDGRRPTLANSL